MAHSMHFNGVDLSGSSYGLTVLAGPVPFLPGARVSMKALGTRPGAYAQGGYLEQRNIPVNGYVTGSSNANLKSKLDALRLLLDPANGEQSIRFDHLSDRYFLGRLSGDMSFDYVGPSSCAVELRFTCADPLGFATSETTQVVAIDTDPEIGSVPATGVAAGTAYARPVWKVKNTSGAAVSSIALTNSTTGESVACTYTVPNNHWVRFDSQRERLQYSVNDSTWTDIMSYLSTSAKLFPRLKPGVSNTVVVQGLTAGELTVVYRARYL